MRADIHSFPIQQTHTHLKCFVSRGHLLKVHWAAPPATEKHLSPSEITEPMLCYCLICQNTSRTLENTGINSRFNPKLPLDGKVSFHYHRYWSDVLRTGTAPGSLFSWLGLTLEAAQAESFIPSPAPVSSSFRAALNVCCCDCGYQKQLLNVHSGKWN